MTNATDVGHAVLVALLICRIRRAFQVNHNLLPAFCINWDDRLLLLLLRHPAEAKAGNTLLPPLFDVILDGRPPGLTQNKSSGLIRVTMRPQHASMALQKHPTFPGKVARSKTFRNDRNPRGATWRWKRHQTLEEAICSKPEAFSQRLSFEQWHQGGVSALSCNPCHAQGLTHIELNLASLGASLFRESITLRSCLLIPSKSLLV